MPHYTAICYSVKRRAATAAILCPVEDRLLTVKQVAERLQVHEETVRRWLRERRLRGVKLGSNRAGFRIPESELKRLTELQPE
jgi:excisionase family DNA binding protein